MLSTDSLPVVLPPSSMDIGLLLLTIGAVTLGPLAKTPTNHCLTFFKYAGARARGCLC